MDAKNIVIIWLSLQIFGLSIAITKLSYDNGYLKGRASVYLEFAEDGTEGTKYYKEIKKHG